MLTKSTKIQLIMFPQSLIHVDAKNFLHPHVKTQSLQLNLNVEFESILQTVRGNDSHRFIVYGEPGSGCSTLVHGLCQCLCESADIKPSEILCLLLSHECSEESWWDIMCEVAKVRNDKTKAMLFSKVSVQSEEKLKALTSFLQDNFKVMCFDNVDCNEILNESFLSDTLKSLKIKTFIINHQGNSQILATSESIMGIEVKGLNSSSAEELFSKLYHPHTLDDIHISKLCTVLNNNPVAIEILCAFMKVQKTENVEDFVKGTIDNLSFTKKLLPENDFGQSAVGRVLKFIKQNLKPLEISVLYELSKLRRPLPIVKIKPEIQKLFELELLSMEQKENTSCISVHPCLEKHLSYSKMAEPVEDTDFGVLQCWLSLVSDKLQSLVHDAEENAWPFVPEKWQYTKNVGKDENYNVKELITSKNSHNSSLTELQILKECLYHAYLQNDFQKLAALVLVLDRFLYWQGDAKSTLEVVDYIQRNSPKTAIAPQLIIRRARFMKNNGNLRGADETLNRLLQAKSEIDQWKYREDDQCTCVHGVCVQIKGEIQYSLGHWLEGARLLIRSIQYFGCLQQPDKKGLASSYGLLCLCLRNMTVADYAILAHSCHLLQCHPLLAAYFSAQEAARSSVYTPMFFLRHICQAGEVMIQFVKLATHVPEQQQLLKVAIEDLKDSIQAHQTYTSLSSREQLYLLVCALYKAGLAFTQLQSMMDQERGQTLKALSLELYQHYCHSSGHILVNDYVIKLIDKCLTLLDLEKFLQDDLPNAGEVLVDYFNKRSARRAEENTSITRMGLFNSSERLFSVPKGAFDKSGPIVKPPDCNASCNVKDKIVDRCSDTVEAEEEEVTSLVPKEVSMEDKIVDRCSDTVEAEEEQVTPPVHKEVPMEDKIVDRCSDTVEAAEGEVTPNPLVPKEVSMEDKIVDRCSDTVEEAEGEVTPDPLVPKEVSMKDKIVDRCSDKIEEAEEEVIPLVHNKVPSKEDKIVDQCPEANDSILSSIDQASQNGIIEKEFQNGQQQRFKTVDECALTIGTMEHGTPQRQGVIMQNLDDEAASLPSQTHEISLATGNEFDQITTSASKTKGVKDAILWKYDFSSQQWRGQLTMVHIGDPLKLDKGKQGAQRDVYTVEFINQDEPLGRYVAKRYRKEKGTKQYENDLLSQMTARHYVALFNQALFQVSTRAAVGDIQFLPVVLLQLVNSKGQVTEVFNAEPYMSGEFIKLTNNVDWKNEQRRTDLVLAYSHFTYQASDKNLIIVDIQGWAPLDNRGCTFLTDPQIHSTVYKCFGTGNFKEKGYDNFWKMHSECNEICKMLRLVRPLNK